MQERAGHSSIGLPMDLYGKIAGQMALTSEQEARFEALAVKALPASVSIEPTTDSGTASASDSDPTKSPTPQTIP